MSDQPFDAPITERRDIIITGELKGGRSVTTHAATIVKTMVEEMNNTIVAIMTSKGDWRGYPIHGYHCKTMRSKPVCKIDIMGVNANLGHEFEIAWRFGGAGSNREVTQILMRGLMNIVSEIIKIPYEGKFNGEINTILRTTTLTLYMEAYIIYIYIYSVFTLTTTFFSLQK